MAERCLLLLRGAVRTKVAIAALPPAVGAKLGRGFTPFAKWRFRPLRRLVAFVIQKDHGELPQGIGPG
jgi:hypothetical protein